MTKKCWVNKGKIVDFVEIGDYKWRAIFSDGISTDINMVATSFTTLLYKLGLMGVDVSEHALIQAQKYIDNWHEEKILNNEALKQSYKIRKEYE